MNAWTVGRVGILVDLCSIYKCPTVTIRVANTIVKMALANWCTSFIPSHPSQTTLGGMRTSVRPARFRGASAVFMKAHKVARAADRSGGEPEPEIEIAGGNAGTHSGLQFPDHLFGCKLSVGLGSEIVRRHNAGHGLALNFGVRSSNGGYGRAPVTRSALIGNNRKLRYLGHVASGQRPRAHKPAMSTAARAIAGGGGERQVD
jgi:hypothetical protein